MRSPQYFCYSDQNRCVRTPEVIDKPKLSPHTQAHYALAPWTVDHEYSHIEPMLGSPE